MKNFNNVSPLCYWVQKVLPLVYDDSLSYYELLGKVVKKLNELIENNAILPEYIENLIKEYITSGEIEKVVSYVISNFILNVKYPPNGLTPANGNGITDDTETIQGCIDYANETGGKCIFFPSGSYLTQSLTLKDNVSLCGFDYQSTKIVLKGGAKTALINGNVKNCSINNLKLDGNAGIQVNNINVIDITASDLILYNTFLTGGYVLINIAANGKILGDNLILENAIQDGISLTGEGVINFNNLLFLKLSTLNGRYIINNNVVNAVFKGIYSTASSEYAINNTADNAVFIGKIINSANIIKNTGNHIFTDFYNGGGTVFEMVKNEETARIENDKNLQTAINNEISNREEEDNNLQTAINNEISNREEQDNNLQNAINNEISNRKEEDNNLKVIINDKQNLKTIKEYGAKGDGVTDDSEAFVKAFSDEEHRPIFVPNGTYLLNTFSIPTNSKQILITDNGVNFTGNNKGHLQNGSCEQAFVNQADTQCSKWLLSVNTADGGETSYVCPTLDVQTLVKSETNNNYVWGILSRLDNYSKSLSQNVAIYGQTRARYAEGFSWAACMELIDMSANPTTSKIGLEISMNVSEDDTNEQRIGLHISAGVNPGATGGNVGTGIELSGRNDQHYYAGIRFKQCYFDRGIYFEKCNGSYGIDLSEGNFIACAIKSKSGDDGGFQIGDYFISAQTEGLTLATADNKQKGLIIMNNRIVKATEGIAIKDRIFINGNINATAGSNISTYLEVLIDGAKKLIPCYDEV
jgi:hypothetical protein